MKISLAVFALGGVGALAADSPYVVISPEFSQILGSNPKITVVFNESIPLFHEGGIYHPGTDSLWLTTNELEDGQYPSIANGKAGEYIVHVTNLSTPKPELKVLSDFPIPNPLGGARYFHDGADKLVFAALGNMDSGTPGGIYAVDPYTFEVEPWTTSYGDFPYDGPDDATVLSDGSVWFTDLTYGYIEGLRPKSQLPSYIYRYDPKTNSTRAMADGFSRPNGITHSPGDDIIYLCDTGVYVGDGTLDYTAPRSIYALSNKEFKTQHHKSTGPFLTDRRTFALPLAGAVSAIKTDTNGNVWGFNTDGLHVWNQNGDFIGKVLMDMGQRGGNFGFGKPGEVYVAAGTALLKLEVSKSVVGTGVEPSK